MEVLNRIIEARRQGRKLLALLLDPEKTRPDSLPLGPENGPDIVLVGGSTGRGSDELIAAVRAQTSAPVVLFPGSAEQVSAEADALLFLSLLSGRDAEWLVGEQVRAARMVKQSGLETIPTGYILIDGGAETSVMRVTGTCPISPQDINQIVDTALAAEMMGKQLVYLEAGSGARTPVSPEIIRAVREAIALPLVVGGGIRTPEAMQAALDAGADIVVIGNHFETHPEALKEFCNFQNGSINNQTANDQTANADDVRYMRLALLEAEKAYAAGEVPVGCLIVSNGQIIGRGHNLTETLHDVTAHAEIQAVTAAAQTLGAKYMPDATLYVTVEPCVMCAGAIGWSQIRRVVFGCEDEKRGFTRFAPHALHPKCAVTRGVLEEECKMLMQQFFKQRR